MNIKPFENCPAMDGYHCQTNSLAKIYRYFNHPLSEDMLLGLGAGMGFIHWPMKGDPETGQGDSVFIGGRGNNKGFFSDLGQRTGVRITLTKSSSVKKAEKALLDKLNRNEPVMVFGDMGYLPWFHFPEEYHFGGHTFVLCGYDGKDTVLASDMDPKTGGLKKGFYHPITLPELSRARNSAYNPFPPHNACLDFDFTNYRTPAGEDIYSSIRQTAEAMLHPPIKNMGIKGLRHTAGKLSGWPDVFYDNDLRMNLFGLYIYIEIGGTGGGCFRAMYSRFLEESSGITGNQELLKASGKIAESGGLFSKIGLMFKNAMNDPDISEKIKTAAGMFNHIADIEEETFGFLAGVIQ